MLPPIKTAETALNGEWDRAADCFIAPGASAYGRQSFTIGLFQWTLRKSGGLKRGPVQRRIKGYPSRSQQALDEANRAVAQLNSANVCEAPAAAPR